MLKSLFAAAGSVALIAGGTVAQQGSSPPDVAMEEPAPLQADERKRSTEYGADQYGRQDAQSAELENISTKGDAEAFAKSAFKSADANADAKVEREEFARYVKSKTSSEEGAQTPSSSGDAARAAGAAQAKADAAFEDISAGDGSISEEEMVNSVVDDFETADANADDELDDAERRQFAALVMNEDASSL